jgi:excinuclease UvrABC nuclease subunit
METIDVSKVELLAKLKQNREEHKDLFQKAQVKWREKFIEALDERLAQAKAGKPVSIFFSLPEPVNYTEAFDQAILMVEWAQGAIITLDERDFRRYVMNQWEWAKVFAENTASYAAMA